MNFNIKRRDAEGFKIWLSLIGYVRKDLPDGGYTFKGRGTKHEYVLITKDLSGNNACKILYAEYRGHIATPDLTATEGGLRNLHNTLMGKDNERAKN